jgi:hypothetical protein
MAQNNAKKASLFLVNVISIKETERVYNELRLTTTLLYVRRNQKGIFLHVQQNWENILCR